MAAKLSALRAGRTLPPGFFIFKDSWYSFLLEAELTPGPVRPEGLGEFKKSTSSGLEPATETCRRSNFCTKVTTYNRLRARQEVAPTRVPLQSKS
jgi:hypothetical protein